jgi:DNA polymerase-4
MAILDEYSPLVVPMSVDEAYMDMTGTERSLGDPLDTANKIRTHVKDSLGLPVSIGIGPSKLVAKVATEHAKPNGVFRVRQEDARAFFAPQPVRNMPGIGPKAEEALKELGITTLGQLATAEDGPLRRALGPNHSGYVKQRAQGIDRSPIRERPKSKSISAETTFSSDVIEIEKLEEVLKDLSERVGTRLRRTGQLAKQAFTRQKTFVTPGDGDQLIYETTVGLLRVEMARRGDPVRLIGVSVSGLGEQAAQLSLLDATPLIDTHTSEAIDSIRERYGSDSISRGMKSKST